MAQQPPRRTAWGNVGFTRSAQRLHPDGSGADAPSMGSVLFAVRAVVAVLVAAVVLGFLVTPGTRQPADNPVIAVAQAGVEGLAAAGRGLVDLAIDAGSDRRGR